MKLSESLVYLLDRRPDGVSSGDERPAGGTNSIGLWTKKMVHRNEASAGFSVPDSCWWSLKIPSHPSQV